MEQLDRLMQNQDFIDLFVEGFNQESIELVKRRAYPGNAYSEDRLNIIHSRMGMIGEFNIYLQQIRQTGQSAQDAMDDHKQEREGIISESAVEVI